jgi:ABC-type polysaccharide/polyol phosphate export permease
VIRPRETFELARARMLVFLREPEVVFWVFAFPLVLAAVLGWAFRDAEVEPSQVALVKGAGAEALAQRLADVENVELTWFDTRDEVLAKLRRGTLDALIEPADGTGDEAEDGADAPPRLVLDPSRPEADATRLRLLVALGAAAGDGARRPLLALDPIEERGSRYVDFLFPGLIGLNLMGTGMWLLGMATADLRQRKLLKRLLVTPMRKESFLGGLIGARMAFLAAEVAVLAAFGAFVLGIPFEGGLAPFAALSVLGALSFAGLGMLATARVKTVQGASGLLNVAMMPMWLLSGVFFSYERFPEFLHPALRLLPLSALNDGLRATMLEGAGVAGIGPELLVLTVWGAVSFLLALRFFRWQ